MFTGLIEETGQIKAIARGAKSARITVKANKVLEGLQTGDSIATNGICLTAVSQDGDSFTVDVMAETMSRTNLGQLSPGSSVNLERALPLGGRLGGHIVSGHIDGTGTLTGLAREDNAVWLTVSAPPEILRYVVEKGSIAIDGVSLTVAGVDGEGFRVSIIPHTGVETTLLSKKSGDTVNLECDIIGKYVEKLLRPKEAAPAKAITMDFLAEKGFV